MAVLVPGNCLARPSMRNNPAVRPRIEVVKGLMRGVAGGRGGGKACWALVG